MALEKFNNGIYQRVMLIHGQPGRIKSCKPCSNRSTLVINATDHCPPLSFCADCKPDQTQTQTRTSAMLTHRCRTTIFNCSRPREPRRACQGSGLRSKIKALPLEGEDRLFRRKLQLISRIITTSQFSVRDTIQPASVEQPRQASQVSPSKRSDEESIEFVVEKSRPSFGGDQRKTSVYY